MASLWIVGRSWFVLSDYPPSPAPMRFCRVLLPCALAACSCCTLLPAFTMLVTCRAAGVRIQYHASVEDIVQGGTASGPNQAQGVSAPDEPRWRIELADGTSIAAKRIIMATGGLSFPAVGTDGTGHRILHNVQSCPHAMCRILFEGHNALYTIFHDRRYH